LPLWQQTRSEYHATNIAWDYKLSPEGFLKRYCSK
jgi:hypothetical protein